MRKTRQTIAATALFSLASTAPADFASIVHEYTPAPGQFVNNANFSDPARALGPPVGGGTLAASNVSVVSLGGFGGRLTLGFAQTVENHPSNPLGLDFIVFGNAFWPSGDPKVRWGEGAIIEISRDANGNGLPDDPWFLIPGSHLASPASALQSQEWDADANTATPPSNLAWYPAGAPSPMTTQTFRLPAAFESFTLVNTAGAGMESFYGYGDLSPTLLLGDYSGASGAASDNTLSDPEDNPAIDPGAFYTAPDDPFTTGVDPGSGGGDAFDIDWAIDAATGEPANLAGFDFIRISTGAHAVVGPLGEVSVEIDAVADVRPASVAADLNGDGLVNGADLAALLANWNGAGDADLNGDGVIDGADLATLLANWSAP